MRKNIIIILLAACCLCGCGSKPASRKYVNYQLYDNHLYCTDVEEESVRAICESENARGSFNARRLKNIPDEQFICARYRASIFAGYYINVILQNPDNYVDVINEWTISSVELYLYLRNKDDELARTPDKIVASTDNQDVICELLEFLNNDEYSKSVFLSDSVVSYDEYGQKDKQKYELFLRVNFEEAENIVWDTEVWSGIRNEGSRYIIVDRIHSEVFLPNGLEIYAPIDDYPELYEWVNSAIEDIVSEAADADTI